MDRTHIAKLHLIPVNGLKFVFNKVAKRAERLQYLVDNASTFAFN